jgi:hypothetical protein
VFFCCFFFRLFCFVLVLGLLLFVFWVCFGCRFFWEEPILLGSINFFGKYRFSRKVSILSGSMFHICVCVFPTDVYCLVCADKKKRPFWKGKRDLIRISTGILEASPLVMISGVLGYGLWVVRCALWVVGHGLWVVGCVLWLMAYGLWVVGCRLWVVGWGLWVMGYKLGLRLRLRVGWG